MKTSFLFWVQLVTCLTILFTATGSAQMEGEGVMALIPLLLLCPDKDSDGFYAGMGCGSPTDCDDENPNVRPGATDVPDVSFIDTNCDGIDGDRSAAVFVATPAAGGNDDNDGLDPATPKATLGKAIVAAMSSGRTQILMQQGTYNEVVEMPDFAGGGIYGGYDYSWTRNETSITKIEGGASSNGQYMTIMAHNASGSFYDLQLIGPIAIGTSGGYGLSSYVVHAKNSDLLFERVVFIQGHGADGQDGTNGDSFSPTNAPGGSAGEDGLQSVEFCSTSYGAGGMGATNSDCPENTGGGSGGNGGPQDTVCNPLGYNFADQPGVSGTDAALTGIDFGHGGSGGPLCGDGTPGEDGRTIEGSGGIAAQGGVLFGDYWYGARGGDGQLGQHGTGGGGGGGGGGCDTGIFAYGAGGGGGGAGGCRAPSAGTGGYGGGGSFGIFALDSTIAVKDSIFTRGWGGNGGQGGNGGSGQAGGQSGPGGAGGGGTGPGGGEGGYGGRGGHSGGGAGGEGGYSYGIYYSNSVVTQKGNTFSNGFAGIGGIGGEASAESITGQYGFSGALGSVGAM